MVSPLWKLTKQQAADAVKAYVKGESAHAIGKRLGVSLHAIRYHVRKAGLWKGRRLPRITDRFWAKVKKGRGCWLWTGAQFPNGYGCFSVQGQSVLAHRVAYELHYGPIPLRLTVDHIWPECRSKLCVRWKHLEAVTSGENTRRGRAAKGKNYVLKLASQ